MNISHLMKRTGSFEFNKLYVALRNAEAEQTADPDGVSESTETMKAFDAAMRRYFGNDEEVDKIYLANSLPYSEKAYWVAMRNRVFKRERRNRAAKFFHQWPLNGETELFEHQLRDSITEGKAVLQYMDPLEKHFGMDTMRARRVTVVRREITDGIERALEWLCGVKKVDFKETREFISDAQPWPDRLLHVADSLDDNGFRDGVHVYCENFWVEQCSEYGATWFEVVSGARRDDHIRFKTLAEASDFLFEDCARTNDLNLEVYLSAHYAARRRADVLTEDELEDATQAFYSKVAEIRGITTGENDPGATVEFDKAARKAADAFIWCNTDPEGVKF